MRLRHGIIPIHCEHRHRLTTYTVSPSRPDGNIHDQSCAVKVTMEHTRRLSLSFNDEPHLTAQVPTTHEWNTASLQFSTRRQERTPVDTTLSLTCKRRVDHRICSRSSELHPRFDQKLLAHQDFFLLQTKNLACCTITWSLSKAALGPKRLNLKSCKLTVNSNSGPNCTT